MPHTERTITLTGDKLSPHIEAALERLYRSPFALPDYHRVFGSLDGIGVYTVLHDGQPACIWLFRRNKGVVRVLNEGISVDGEEAEQFARMLFASERDIHTVLFHAVRPQSGVPALPHLRFNCLEDIVATLPDSEAAYFASLGKSTRSYLRRYQHRLERDFPGYSVQVHERERIAEHDLRRVIEFNRLRMAGKGRASINDEAVAERIVRFARTRGMLCAISIGGRLCAGAITYCVGGNYFLETLAHDPAWDDYRLGMLCCYQSVLAAIARGGREYHFLWGQDEYKMRLRGQQRDLDDLLLYRSRLRMLLHGNAVAHQALLALLRRAQLWLREERKRQGTAARLVDVLLHTVRLHLR